LTLSGTSVSHSAECDSNGPYPVSNLQLHLSQKWRGIIIVKVWPTTVFPGNKTSPPLLLFFEVA
jgi:hypothetical protein